MRNLSWNSEKPSSCPEVFCSKDTLENVAKFTRKLLCRSLLLNEVADWTTPTLLKSARNFLWIFAQFDSYLAGFHVLLKRCLTRLEADEINVSRTSPFLSMWNFFVIVPWQEIIEIKMLNLALATDFIFYIVATPCSCSLVFCSKVFLDYS